MDKDKQQIEKIALEVRKGIAKQGRSCITVGIAEHLYDIGYREQNENTIEVVKCKDCVHQIKDEWGKCHCLLGNYYCDDTDYCGRNKRR